MMILCVYTSCYPPNTLQCAAYEQHVSVVNASNTSFGNSLFNPSAEEVCIRYGFWGHDNESTSSNFHELSNLVSSLETAVGSGFADLSEVFLFTDNTTAECMYYKGNSTNKKLFDLVLCLRTLEMWSNLLLHVIHVAGTRMILQGTDGISCRVLSNSIFNQCQWAVSLHLLACECSNSLLPWLKSWVPQAHLTPLTPSVWYTRGHGTCSFTHNLDGVLIPLVDDQPWYLWNPPPATACVALEELATS